MKIRSYSSLFLPVFAMLALCALAPSLMAQEVAEAGEAAEAAANASSFVGTYGALLPPVIAIGLALLT